MNALEKFRQQVRIAREGKSYVVQTADEAQAGNYHYDGTRPAKGPYD